MTIPPLLSVKNLKVSFSVGRRAVAEVVQGVSFDIRPRDTLAVVGESGSGKSVTSLAIMGLLPPRTSRVEGQIYLQDQDLLRLPAKRLKALRGNDLAMIFQEPMTALNPLLTIGDQIGEVLVKHRRMSRTEARSETLRLLERVRIPAARSRMNEYPHRFSGGMRQRAMIAMALAGRPKLLIADEPTTALDVTIQAQILELIKTIQDEEGMALLFITHDMGVVAEIADRAIVMHNGKAVEAGQTETIFENPTHPYTKMLLSSVPRLGAVKDAVKPAPATVLQGGDEPAASAKPAQPGAATAPVLDVRKLTTRFDLRNAFGMLTGRVHAVENVSFSINKGETLALVGESGCGKSTIGRSITRLVKPVSGQIMVNGQDLLIQDKTAMRRMRRQVQMIFQDPYGSLNPRVNVRDAIGGPLLNYQLATRKDVDERVSSLLSRVGLEPDMRTRLPFEFSGGQRQRISIARALALNPDVVVADEVVSALDVANKVRIMDLIQELQNQLGLAFLFISHDMAVVERLSHRVAVMYLGELVEIGNCKDVFQNPQHSYTRKLLEAVPVPDPKRRHIRRPISNDEIMSPIRATDYVSGAREYRQVSPSHLVLTE